MAKRRRRRSGLPRPVQRVLRRPTGPSGRSAVRGSGIDVAGSISASGLSARPSNPDVGGFAEVTTRCSKTVLASRYSQTNVTGKWERAAAMLGVMHTINQLVWRMSIGNSDSLEMLRCDGRIIL